MAKRRRRSLGALGMGKIAWGSVAVGGVVGYALAVMFLKKKEEEPKAPAAGATGSGATAGLAMLGARARDEFTIRMPASWCAKYPNAQGCAWVKGK